MSIKYRIETLEDKLGKDDKENEMQGEIEPNGAFVARYLRRSGTTLEELVAESWMEHEKSR
jgi:hypothetical protein